MNESGRYELADCNESKKVYTWFETHDCRRDHSSKQVASSTASVRLTHQHWRGENIHRPASFFKGSNKIISTRCFPSCSPSIRCPPTSSMTYTGTSHETNTSTIFQPRPNIELTYKLRWFPWGYKQKRMTRYMSENKRKTPHLICKRDTKSRLPRNHLVYTNTRGNGTDQFFLVRDCKVISGNQYDFCSEKNTITSVKLCQDGISTRLTIHRKKN